MAGAASSASSAARVRGPKLNGRILPGGADWQIIRNDGAADIQARYTIETDGGGLILVDSEGLRHGPPEVMAALARGEAVDPAQLLFPHRDAVRDRRSGRSTGSTASWPRAAASARRVRCGSTFSRWCELYRLTGLEAGR